MNFRFLFVLLFFLTLCYSNVYIDNSIYENLEENEEVNLIVIFKEDEISLKSINSKVDEIISQTSLVKKENLRELNSINGFASKINREDFEKLKNNQNIEAIYYDYPIYLALEDSIPLINADSVWKMQYSGEQITGKRQTICVIDTGIDYTHPYLGNCTQEEFLSGECEKVPGGYDIRNNNSNPFDYHGHGTHCAGIIASTHPIYRGVAPDSNIVAVKVFPDDGGSTSFSYVAEGIQWCINNRDVFNISVISMSLGDNVRRTNYCNSDFLAQYVDLAVSYNMSVVVATGNEEFTNGITSPACVESAIRVTATDKSDAFPSFANRGGNFNDIITAPGVSIYSTVPGGFNFKSGTSMSTPHIAGAIALYNQFHFDKYGYYISPNDVIEKINSTGKIVYDSSSEKNYSRLDAYEFVYNNHSHIENVYNASSKYSLFDEIHFEIILSKPVSNVYVNITLPNFTSEKIHLTNYTLYNYNESYLLDSPGEYSFFYVVNDSNFEIHSDIFYFDVYEYICVNFSDCNSSIFEYNKISLNNSLVLKEGEYFTFNDETEFNCNNYEIYNSSYFGIIGENSSLKNCVFYGEEFEFNSTYSFNLYNVYFMNHSQILFNHSIVPIGKSYILLNEKVIANSINTTAHYKINKICDGLEIDILRLNEITNSTKDFFNSTYFSTCTNNSIEFNSNLNGSYTYNIFNLTVSNTTGGRTNTIYNYTYNFNISNNYLMNDLYNISFIISNNTLIYFDEFVYVNSSNFSNYIFNISSNVSGNHTLNNSICSTKLNRCLDSNFTIEVLDISSFNKVEIYPYVLSNNSNVTFNLNVSNHDSIWFNLTLPDGTNFIDLYVEEYNYTTNQIGMHNITFYANDTFNYIINYEDYFEVLELEESNLTFKDSKGNLTNITINLFYRNQNLFLDSFSNDSISVYELLYDLEINFSKIKLKLNQVNITSKQFELILDELEHENYLLTNIINNTFTFSGNYTIEFNYSGLDYTNENYLELFKCSDWNFTNNTCNGVFEKRNFILNNISKTIIYSDNTFSAFSIAQSSLSNGDSGSGSSSSGGGSTGGSTGGFSGGGSGGGGGGGAGGGSAILPKDAVYKNISIEIYESELIETENYKLFSLNKNNSINYLFYSKYYGEVCFNGNCSLIEPFEFIEFVSDEKIEIKFEKIKLDKAQILNKTVYETNYTIDELRKDILFYLDEFNKSRENEDKCAFFLGYHISPCADKQSCLFACRSMPLCSGLSNSDIFLNYSKFIYLNVQELNKEIENCYSIINSFEDVGEYKECVLKIYNISKTIESSPVFGTCPTCLGVCEDTNYSYDSLNNIIHSTSNYEKQFIFEDVNLIEYNVKSNKLNSLLDKVIEINKTISYSNRRILELIYLHNEFNEFDSKEIEKELNGILNNIKLYNEMNCTSNYERFLTLNHFNHELENCLMEVELTSEEIDGCEDCGEPNFPLILLICLIIIGFFFLYKKLKL